MDSDTLKDLIDAVCNETATDHQRRQLEELLSSSADARSQYRRAMNLQAALVEQAEREPEEITLAKSASRPWLVPLSLAAAAVAVAVALTLVWVSDRADTEDLADDSTSSRSENIDSVPSAGEAPRAFAVLTGAVDVKWAEQSLRPHVGGSFVPGKIELLEGLANIDFFCGANVVLEGPACLQFVSADRGILHHGKLRAYVPQQARGFTIVTESASFVDLGTEFGLSCEVDGSAELHVFDGEVEVRDRSAAGRQPQLVTSGDGLLVGGEEWQGIASDQSGFVNSARVSELELAGNSGRFKRWRDEHLRLAQHPELVAYYDFESTSTSERTLFDRGPNALHGAIVGCSWAEGRLPGKGALEFKQDGDRVRLDIPGEFESLTMMVWLRIDGFDRFFNSILLTDAFSNGNAHWQVQQSGSLDLGIKPPAAKRQVYLAKKQLNMNDLGRWIHLAMVYDRQAKQVRHYVNGERVAVLRIPPSHDFPLQIGPADIGNWNPQDPGLTMPIRSLNGRMDELAIFSTAIPDEEIRAHFELGDLR